MSDSVLRDYKQGFPNAEDNMTANGEENGEDLEDDFEPQDIYMKDRRRAKSLPAYPEQANLFDGISQNGKKRVKFADALGLNLASVKHFNTAEDVEIPSKVFSRLQSISPQQECEFLSDLCGNFKYTLTMDRLVPTFQMPVDYGDFEKRVQRCNVVLEKVTITQFDVRGLIRALTSGCCKREVGVRYTFNNWLSFVDAQAIPMPGEDNAVLGERFAFTMHTPPFLEPSASVHFALYSRTDCGEFWDNNEGHNYTLKHHGIPPFETAAFNAF